jgi:predicted nucleic acid-binding protein
MRVVVADATPLHYLILIGAIEILPRLFEKIHVPIEIRDELSRKKGDV